MAEGFEVMTNDICLLLIKCKDAFLFIKFIHDETHSFYFAEYGMITEVTVHPGISVGCHF